MVTIRPTVPFLRSPIVGRSAHRTGPRLGVSGYSSLRTALLGAASWVVTACAGVAGPPVQVISPTGIVYEIGTPPTATRFSQTGSLYITQGLTERALELALLGIDAEPGNPIHYMLAGLAYVRLEQYIDADKNFIRAQEIYPAYEIDIEPEREAAWIQLFNAGIAAYADEDIERTIEAWEQAGMMFPLRADASLNLSTLYNGEGRWDDAISAYERLVMGLGRSPVTRNLTPVEIQNRADMRERAEESLTQLYLFRERFSEAEPLLRRHLEADSSDVQVRGDLAAVLHGLGQDGEAAEIYSSLLSETGLSARDLFNVGIALYRTGDFMAAAEAFERLTRIQPDSRDAWFNYANALFAAEAWESLATVGDRLAEVDPLGENSGLIGARAHLELGDEDSAVQGLNRTEAAPIYLDGMQLRPTDSDVLLQGQAIGNAAEPGSSVRVRFMFYGGDGVLGDETVTIFAPSAGEREMFEVPFGGRATSYRYELVSPPNP